MFSEYGKVILLIPSTSKEESLEILKDRSQSKLNERFVMSESNERPKDCVLYTKGKTPQEFADEIQELNI